MKIVLFFSLFPASPIIKKKKQIGDVISFLEIFNAELVKIAYGINRRTKYIPGDAT